MPSTTPPTISSTRRFVREGNGEDFARPGAADGQNVGDAHGEHAGLAGSGAGEHQHRTVQRLDREPLFRIKPGEIGRRRRGSHRACGDAAGSGTRRCGRFEVAFERFNQSVVRNDAGIH
jgi:hypothetical protein